MREIYAMKIHHVMKIYQNDKICNKSYSLIDDNCLCLPLTLIYRYVADEKNED